MERESDDIMMNRGENGFRVSMLKCVWFCVCDVLRDMNMNTDN